MEDAPIEKLKDRRIRVLFISHGSGPGGAELSLLGLLKGLDRDRFEPYVILPCAGKMRAPLEAMGVEVRAPPLEHWIPSSAIWGVGHWWRLMFRLRGRVAKLASIIREYRIDLVYTNTVTVIDGALAALVTRRPHVWHARERYSGNDDIKGYLPGWAIKHVILALSDRVIVNSNALAQAFATSGHRSKVTRIYNGVEVHAFESPGTSRVDLESQLGIPRSFVLLGMFGRLSERKDPMTLVRAVHQLRVGGMQVACLFVGQGDQGYVDHLRLVARDLGVDDLVFFAGQRSDVPALMGAIDILVLASKDEPFGRVLIEGMAAGVMQYLPSGQTWSLFTAQRARGNSSTDTRSADTWW